MSKVTPNQPEGTIHRRRLALAKVLRTFDLARCEPPAVGSCASFSTTTEGAGRLYGGMTLALGYLAAAKTVDQEHRLHSITGTFLCAGRPERELGCNAFLLRNGRSFSSRRTEVRQGNSVLFEGIVGFRKASRSGSAAPTQRKGINHSTARAPHTKGPELCLDREQERLKRLGLKWLEHPVNAVEVRVSDERHLQPEVQLPPRSVNWVRVPSKEPQDQTTRIALLLYASDRALLSTAALPHGILWSRSQAVTLNHSLWLHRTPSPQDWHLFVTESRIATDGLAVLHLEIFNPHRQLVATVVQEALVQY